MASTKDADSVTDSCTMCSTNTFTDSTIASTEDPAMDGSTISSPEWTTELMVDNGNGENENINGNENKNENQNEDKTTEAGTKTGEKADIIEKNKATTRPFAISTDAGNALILHEKLESENSTLTEVTTGAGIRIFIYAKIVDINEIFFLESRKANQRLL